MALTQTGESNFLNRLEEITKANLSDERFGVNELARKMGMSRSNLHRKLKATKGLSISTYIRHCRLERAKDLLKQSSSTVAEVAFEVGFSSSTYFSKCFHDRYGYAPGEVRKGGNEGAGSEEGQKESRKFAFRGTRVSLAVLLSVVGLILASAVLFFLFDPFERMGPPLDKSIAVLPFFNDSPEETEMYFINGTMEAILNNLCKIEDLHVVSRNSVEQYRDNPKPTKVVAEEMNVSYILEGSGMKQGDRIFLTLQLIDARHDRHLWSESYQKNTDQVFDLFSEVSQLVADQIQALITPEEKQRIEAIPTNNPEAYDNYLQGMTLSYGGDQDRWKAIEYFQRAVDLDSSFALAYSGMADVYLLQVSKAILSHEEGLPEAKKYAQIALALDEKLAEAHCQLGQVKLSYDYDLEGAKKEYISALELNSNSVVAHLGYARYLSLMGRYDESALFYNSAQKLDPSSIIWHRYLNQYYAGQRKEAMDAMEQNLDACPNDLVGLWYTAILYTDLEMYDEAVRRLQTRITLMGQDNISDEIGLLGYIYGRLGQRDKAKHQLDQLDKLAAEGEYVSPRARVWIYLGLGEVGTAVELLRMGLANHTFGPLFLRFYPREFVRNDPLFIQLQKEMGLLPG